MRKTLAGHLEFASRLFGAGEVVKAGQIWQAILKREPSSPEALSGLLRVREIMAEAPIPGPGAADAPFRADIAGPAAQAAGPEFDASLAKGCALYDRGDPRGALEAWERAQAIDPGNALVLSYIRGVRKELGLPMQERPAHPPAGTAGLPKAQAAASKRAPSQPHADEVERLLRAGVKCYEKGLFGKALQEWERAQALDPDNGLTKGYLGLVRSEAGGPGPARDGMGKPPQKEPALAARGGGAGPYPLGSSETTLRISRSGLRDGPNSSGAGADGPRPSGAGSGRPPQVPTAIVRAPALDRQLEFKENSASPVLRLLLGSRLVAWAVVAAILLSPALFVFRNMRKDALLVAARTAIRDSAIERAGRSDRTERLMPTVGELCQESRSLLRSDPLRAYLLADGALKMDRLDASAPRLMEEARQAMQEHPGPAPSGNFARLMVVGDLEAAAGLLDSQLRRNPNDAKARENLARVSLLMARSCAAQGDWDGARSRILLGSALFPGDLEWRARLRLLDHLRVANEDERRRWIGLLG